MTRKEKKHDLNFYLGVLISLFAVSVITSLFDDDNSKVVSKQGRRILNDNSKLKDLENKILDAKEKDEDVYID